jgi:hypothetical protein
MVRTIKRELTWREPGPLKKLWDLTWGLVLVVGLTVVSECGLRMGYTKTPPDAQQVVSQPMMHAVK